MGSLCTSLFGQSQTTGYQAPPEIKSAITDILNRAAVQSNQPYPQYTPETAAQYMGYNPGLVAPLTPNQAAAGQTISGMQGYTQPYFGAATQLAAGAAMPVMAQPFSGQAVNQYMSPYLSDVVNSAVANINQTNAQQQQQVLGNAIQKGAFGGDRAGIAQAELARQQNLANNATIANLLNQGYGQALNQFNVQQQLGANLGLQNRQLMSNAALNLANLGTQGQQAALQQAQAQYGYGTQEQQQQQANLSTAYQQYLQQQAFPYQQLSYYAGLASGAAPAMGGQTTVYSPTQSLAGGVLGGLNTLGQLTNPASYQSKGFLSGIGNLMGGFTGINPLGAPGLKQGGRVGYADGGVPTNQSIREAYDDYVGAVSSGAPYDVLMQLYNRYQQAFKNASLPAKITPVQPAAKADVAAEKAAPASAATGRGSGDGGGGAADRNAPTTVQNAAYSPDYTSSNGPVGGVGGYGPYYAGGGPGDTFNQGGLGDLGKGLGQALSLMSPFGILSALNRDPKVVAEEMGKMYAEPNRVAAAAYDDAGNPIEFTNTASGQNLAEYMAQMGIEDPSQVRMGMTQVNGRWQPEFFKDSTIGRMLHPNSVPALDVPGITYGSDSASRQAEEGFAIPGGGEGVAGATTGAAAPGKFGMADLASLNKAYGLPTGYLEAQAQIESGMNPAAKNPYSSAAGMYQIIKSNYEKAGIDPYDPSQAAGWTAQNAADNAEKLRNAGYPVSNATLALAHNFGIQGALALLSNPQRDIFETLKTVMPEDQALAAVTSNKYNISDPSSTALGRLESRMNAALEKIGPLSTQQPDWMQPRGSTITNERPFGNMPEQQTAASQMQQFDRQGLDASAAFQPGASQAQQAERYDLGNIGTQVSPQNVVRAFEAAQPTAPTFAPVVERQISPQNVVREYERSQDRGGGDNSDRNTGAGSGGWGGAGATEARDSGGGGSRGGYSPSAGSSESRSNYTGGYGPPGREKRGGRIEKADAGGISMQYGLPTEEDIQRMAQSFAGAGAYGLSPTQQALAAKGILGAAKGGRIHKQDAGGITPTPETQEVPDYDAAGNVVGTRREPITVSKVAPIKNNEGGIFSQRPSVITPIVEAIPKAGSAVASTASQSIEGQRTPAEVAGRSGQYAPVSYASSTPTPVPSRAAAERESMDKLAKTQVMTPRQAEDKSMKALAEYQPSASDFVSTGQTTPAAPSVGRRRMPDTGLVQETGGKAPQVYAPYVAPPPPDITNLLGWAASGQLLGGGFGTSLANAANNYARGLQAQQEQQLGYQKGQAEVAQKYAETALRDAQTIKEGVHTEGNFTYYIGRDQNGEIYAEGLMPITPGSKQMVGVVTGNTYDQSGPISQGGGQGAAAPAAGQAAPEGQAGKGIPGLAGTAYENENFAPIMGDETQQALNDEINKRGQRAMMQYANNPSAKANTDARAAAAFADADAARKGLGSINKLALAISSVPPTGETAPGSLGQYRYNILSALNDVTSTFFGRQAFTSDDLKLADKLSANEIMNKIRATFANVQNMTTEGSRAARWLEAIADAFPNIGLQLGTSQKLLSQYYGDSLRTRNYGDFAKKYAAASGGVGQDMQNAFGSMPQNQQSRYDKIQDSIYQSMNFHMLKDKNGNPQDPKNWVTENGVYVNPITKLLDGPRKGGWTPEQFNDWAFKTFGIKNFATTFGY